MRAPPLQSRVRLSLAGAPPPLPPRSRARLALSCTRAAAARAPGPALKSLPGSKLTCYFLSGGRHGHFAAPRSPLLPSPRRSPNFQEHGLKASQEEQSLCDFFFLRPIFFLRGALAFFPPRSQPSLFPSFPFFFSFCKHASFLPGALEGAACLKKLKRDATHHPAGSRAA